MITGCVKHVYLLLVTSYCKDLGKFRFSADIKTFGAFLVHVPLIIDFCDAPEIQDSSLKKHFQIRQVNANICLNSSRRISLFFYSQSLIDTCYAQILSFFRILYYIFWINYFVIFFILGVTYSLKIYCYRIYVWHKWCTL